MTSKIRIGISACLLGREVRYDGGHKRDRFIADVLSEHAEFVPVCPEFEIGMGVPRETVRLEYHSDGVRMVAPKSGTDHTQKMRRYASKKSRDLGEEDLSGFILKKDSPSCGVFRVRLLDDEGMPSRKGRGLFAEALIERYPFLPVEEEGRLNDPHLRENFFERVFAYRRLQSMFSGRWTIGKLVAFHSREKLLLLAHDRAAYRELGRIVAQPKAIPRKELVTSYCETFMSGLTKIATTKKHRNVLDHAAGYFKKLLPEEEKAELHGVIEDFAAGLVPLIVPVTLLRHHVRRHGVNYLEGQTYLEPHPRELMLRNHV